MFHPRPSTTTSAHLASFQPPASITRAPCTVPTPSSIYPVFHTTADGHPDLQTPTRRQHFLLPPAPHTPMSAKGDHPPSSPPSRHLHQHPPQSFWISPTPCLRRASGLGHITTTSNTSCSGCEHGESKRPHPPLCPDHHPLPLCLSAEGPSGPTGRPAHHH
jgi:hypothetical protein